MNKKYLIIILAVVLGVILVAVWRNQKVDTDKITELNKSSQQDQRQYKNYTNQNLKISFEQPSEWPIPIEHRGVNYAADFGEAFIGGGRPATRSNWKLDLGLIEKNACEGEDCYQFFLESFPPQNPENILKALKSDELVDLQNDSVVNGNRILKYSAGGICGEQYAYIFGKNSTLSFLSRCGADGNGDPIFDKILASFQFTE